MTDTVRETSVRGARPLPLRAAAAAIFTATVLLSGCAAAPTTASKARFLAVPVTYERHLDAVRNCKPVGAMTYFADKIPVEDNLLGLVFSLSKSAESSVDYSGGGSSGTVWKTTSLENSEGVGVRLFRCPPEYLGKIRAEIKVNAK